jgi:hypothetical protein
MHKCADRITRVAFRAVIPAPTPKRMTFVTKTGMPKREELSGLALLRSTVPPGPKPAWDKAGMSITVLTSPGSRAHRCREL